MKDQNLEDERWSLLASQEAVWEPLMASSASAAAGPCLSRLQIAQASRAALLEHSVGLYPAPHKQLCDSCLPLNEPPPCKGSRVCWMWVTPASAAPQYITHPLRASTALNTGLWSPLDLFQSDSQIEIVLHREVIKNDTPKAVSDTSLPCQKAVISRKMRTDLLLTVMCFLISVFAKFKIRIN